MQFQKCCRLVAFVQIMLKTKTSNNIRDILHEAEGEEHEKEIYHTDPQQHPIVVHYGVSNFMPYDGFDIFDVILQINN